jgi:hypothetical protein
MHAIVFSPEAEKVRAFFADVVGLPPSADAGGGWLIFALPPAELAVHPAEVRATTSFTSCVTTSRPPSPNCEAGAPKWHGMSPIRAGGSLRNPSARRLGVPHLPAPAPVASNVASSTLRGCTILPLTEYRSGWLRSGGCRVRSPGLYRADPQTLAEARGSAARHVRDNVLILCLNDTRGLLAVADRAGEDDIAVAGEFAPRATCLSRACWSRI